MVVEYGCTSLPGRAEVNGVPFSRWAGQMDVALSFCGFLLVGTTWAIVPGGKLPEYLASQRGMICLTVEQDHLGCF